MSVSRIVCVVAWCLVSLIPGASVQAQTGRSSVSVTALRVDPKVEPVVPGYVELLRKQLRDLGLEVEGGVSAREWRRASPSKITTERALAHAKEQKRTHALVVDFRKRDFDLEVSIRAYDVGALRLVSLGRAHGETVRLGAIADEALAQVLPSLGVKRKLPARAPSEPGAEPDPNRSLDLFAAASEAVEALDQKRYAQAWRRVADREELRFLRDEIQKAAKRPGVHRERRVELLAEMGELDTAWSMIFARAEAQLISDRADPDVMLTAGEVQLARGELAQAREFFERAVEVAPDDAAMHEGLGKLQALEEDLEGARKSLEKAVSLEPSLERLQSLAEVLSEPEQKARRLLEAGELAASRLQIETASDQFQRAREFAPVLSPDILDAQASMHADLFDFAPARKAADAAIELAGPTSERLHLVGRSGQALGDEAAAEAAYRQLLELAPEDPAALRELGTIEIGAGRVDEGLAHVEQAVRLEPSDVRSVRALARGRQASGDAAAAVELLADIDRLGGSEAEDLLERAALERELGHDARALETLERAAALEPGDADIYQSLAEVHRDLGNEGEAQKYDSFVLTFAGAHFKKMLGDEEIPTDRPEISASLDALVASLLRAAPGAKKVMVLPLFEDQVWHEQLLDWFQPRVPDQARIVAALEAALGKRATVVASQTPEGYYAGVVQKMQRFGDEASRDVEAVVRLNSIYQADALLLARLERRPAADPEAPAGCGVEAYYIVEARLLSGTDPQQASILTNSACLASGPHTFGEWNLKLASLIGILLILIVYPFARGWGQVHVEFILPPKTRPLFSVRLNRRKPKPEEEVPTNDERWKLREKLQSLNKNEKRLVDGNRVEFGWVAARRRPYYVTVRGPLHDHQTGDLIGTFSAEKQVEVRRGKNVELQFDMCPKQSCVEVRVVAGGAVMRPDGRVGIRGDARTVRFTRGKPAHIYLDPGDYVLVAASGSAVAETAIHVPDCDPMQVVLDVFDDAGQVFNDCADAVTLYLEGHFEGAAQALDEGGMPKQASQVRAMAALPAGNTGLANEQLVDRDADGAFTAIRLDDPEDDRAATALREAGRHTEAAEQFLSHGDLAEAALAFEAVYDWDRAADCYRKLGDKPSLLEVLERAGEGFEAARVAAELEDSNRALSNLKRVDRRDIHYVEACVLMGELLAAREDNDLAIEKLEEALSLASSESLSLKVQERYAGLLEEAGRIDEAIEVYQAIRRIDHDYPGAKERVEELRALQAQLASQLETDARTLIGGAASGALTSSGPPVESRYEIISELGRGAMGIVYKARDTVLGRLVALKKLPDNMQEHELAIEYFLREARSAAALNHPNIVTIYDAGQEGNTYFITMECLEGTPLDAVLKRVGKLSPRDTVILGAQAATGLAYAHAQRIIHRDIKASNLFYTKDRVVKVMDFGLAKAVEEVRKQASVIAGTPYYMPPEQAIGGIVDRRSDLYSLGVTLFQFCTGCVPFQQGDVTYHHAHTPAPDPREKVAEIPESLAQLILQLMAKDPDARVQSADEVVQRLRTVLSEVAR